MPVTRRQLLASSAAAALAAAGGAGLVAWRWWDRPAGEGFTWLSEAEARFVAAYADALFPPGGTPALAGADAGLSGWFDVVLGGMPPDKAQQLKLLLHALENLGVFEGGAPFTELDRETRSAIVRTWTTSPIAPLRGSALSLGVLLGAGYTTHPETAAWFSGWHGCGYGR